MNGAKGSTEGPLSSRCLMDEQCGPAHYSTIARMKWHRTGVSLFHSAILRI